MKQSWWIEVAPDICLSFQADLSALNDKQLDPEAATKAIAHLEVCAGCHDFFDDVRNMASANKSFDDHGSLLAWASTLTGSDLTKSALLHAAESKSLASELASIFYQLGKAYVLLATDEHYQTEVFEPAVRVEIEKTRGRGFVDGVLDAGRNDIDSFDWNNARHLLNGRLTRIEGSLKKGARLLEEALSIDPDHDEARLYQSVVYIHENQCIRAVEGFKHVFDTAIDETNRGHAAVQLGKLSGREGDDRRALVCFRWVAMSGLADRDDRFYFVRYNAAVCYLNLGLVDRSIGMLRQLLDRHPEQASKIAETMASCSPKLQERMANSVGFAEGIFERCPELFEESHAANPTGQKIARSSENESC